MRNAIINVVAFQAGWLACVLSAAHGLPWAGLMVAGAAIAAHLALARSPKAELHLALVALGVGAMFDSLLFTTGWVGYPSGVLVPYAAPYWILAMWALFATTLNSSLAWVKKSLPVAAALGAVCGPLSYVAMPALVLAARRINGVDSPTVAAQLVTVTQD